MNGKSILTMRVLAIGTLLTGLALMAGCGGGGGASVADGGIGGSGVIASGSVTATGSIFVNGVEYRVQDARFEREDEAPEFLNEIQDRVAVGMVVEVEGMLDATGSGGQALTIRYEDLVEGEIDGMTSSAPEIKVLEILAQQVLVEDGLTRFGPGLNFTTIESETGFIEVSGYRRNDGSIQATYLEDRTPTGRREIQGTVTVVDATTFTIAGLTVNYSGTPILTSGDLVEVKGTNYAAATHTLTAASVEFKTAGLSRDDSPKAEVEGFVTVLGADPVPAGATFLVDGQPVRYGVTTVFVGGTAADLSAGTKVEVEGPLTGGTVQALRVEFRENLRLEAEVQSKGTDSLTLAYPAGASVLVVVDPAVTEGAALGGINVGDYVRIRGQQLAALGGDVVVATRLRNDGAGADDKFILQGPVASFVATPGSDGLTILGVSIDTSGFNDTQFKEQETQIGRTAFYTALGSDSNLLVRARGDGLQSAPPAPAWSEVELER